MVGAEDKSPLQRRLARRSSASPRRDGQFTVESRRRSEDRTVSEVAPARETRRDPRTSRDRLPGVPARMSVPETWVQATSRLSTPVGRFLRKLVREVTLLPRETVAEKLCAMHINHKGIDAVIRDRLVRAEAKIEFPDEAIPWSELYDEVPDAVAFEKVGERVLCTEAKKDLYDEITSMKTSDLEPKEDQWAQDLQKTLDTARQIDQSSAEQHTPVSTKDVRTLTTCSATTTMTRTAPTATGTTLGPFSTTTAWALSAAGRLSLPPMWQPVKEIAAAAISTPATPTSGMFPGLPPSYMNWPQLMPMAPISRSAIDAAFGAPSWETTEKDKQRPHQEVPAQLPSRKYDFQTKRIPTKVESPSDKSLSTI
ncbi:unnamed protein product [Trichogramma brassicae]|uniref:Uncharacterized protein n=1 Tax=Trichogramma brassicae TaxID=86971 RepID=A0A6H5HRP2_9HYME|nr:unnamed protein product [Trichogramma brassicae]